MRALVIQLRVMLLMRTTIFPLALVAAALELRATGAKFSCACFEDPAVAFFVVAFFAAGGWLWHNCCK